MSSREETRWWRGSKRSRYNLVRTALEDAYSTSGTRLDSHERALRFYADKTELIVGRNLAYPARLEFNLIRTLAQTARAHLVEYPPPRPAIQTSGGDPDLQRRAQGLTKFMAGAIYQTKFDAKARGKNALRSAVFGVGPMKYSSRFGRLHAESVRPWELFAHRDDEQAGDVRTLYHAYREDRGRLAHLYPQHAEAIDDSDGADLLPWGQGLLSGTTGHRVGVVEAWHLPSAPHAKDGRHIVAIEGLVLCDEPWTAPDFPFSWLPWSEPISDFWPTGLGDTCGPIQRKLNELLNRLQQAIDLCVWPRLLVPRGSKIAPWPPTNEIGSVAFYSGNVRPEWDIARKIDPEIAGQIERLWSKGFQQEGISELAAMAMKPAGLQSGESLRVFHDKASGRMANWSLCEDDLYVDAGEQFLRQARALAEQDPDYTTVYEDKRKRTIEPIRFADVDLDEEVYKIQAYPVSDLPQTPAGRQAVLQERVASGIYTPDQYKRLSRSPDLEAEDALESAPHDWLVRVLDDMTYGDGAYVEPEGLDDIETGITLTKRYYAQARNNNVAPGRLKNLRTFAAALVTLKEKAAAASAPPPGPPGLPPGPPGAAPPLPPPPPM